MRTIAVGMAGVAMACGASLAAGQTTVPIRPIGKTVATSPVPFGSTLQMQVRQLTTGRVLVLDPSHRLLVLLDSALARPKIVIDSAAGLPNSYGTRGGAMIGYLADSTLFVDVTAMTFMVIDPAGAVSRLMALPTGGNISFYLTGGMYGWPGVDAAGRLIYYVNATSGGAARGVGAPSGSAPSPSRPLPPDSAFLVALNFQSRVIDTVGSFKIPITSVLPSGVAAPPLQTVDGWAVTSDGTVAVLKAQDYHIDWIKPDHTRTSTARLPYDWKHLSDADKQRVADSLTAVRDSTQKARLASLPPGARPLFNAAGGLIGYSPLQPGSPPPGGPAPTIPIQAPIDASAIPDYLPPVAAAAVRADADGRLWILTTPTKMVSGGAVYDIVDGKGVLIDRVQLPEGRTLVGFGPGGMVYLGWSDAGVAHLEKVRFK